MVPGIRQILREADDGSELLPVIGNRLSVGLFHGGFLLNGQNGVIEIGFRRGVEVVCAHEIDAQSGQIGGEGETDVQLLPSGWLGGRNETFRMNGLAFGQSDDYDTDGVGASGLNLFDFDGEIENFPRVHMRFRDAPAESADGAVRAVILEMKRIFAGCRFLCALFENGEGGAVPVEVAIGPLPRDISGQIKFPVPCFKARVRPEIGLSSERRRSEERQKGENAFEHR